MKIIRDDPQSPVNILWSKRDIQIHRVPVRPDLAKIGIHETGICIDESRSSLGQDPWRSFNFWLVVKCSHLRTSGLTKNSGTSRRTYLKTPGRLVSDRRDLY